MADQLAELASSLRGINARFAEYELGRAAPMSASADELERRFGEGRQPDADLVSTALRRFAATNELRSYADTRNVCYGVSIASEAGRALIEDRRGLALLLQAVDKLTSSPRRLRRCFHALSSAYLSRGTSPNDGDADWETLRSRLEAWLPSLLKLTPRPAWVGGLADHQNLLTRDDPTSRYASECLSGESTGFDDACERLTIGQSSWLRDRVILSAVDAACSKSHEEFNLLTQRIIDLVRRHPGVQREAASRLLGRYSAQDSRAPHPGLRALAIETFGNPLVTANKQRWFEVPQKARELVTDWMKGFLIERFFELLSHDGVTDRRRPEFWLRYRGSIDNIWFVLGRNAMTNEALDFRRVRDAMGSQWLPLVDATGNNAFVMKLGRLCVVEFGEVGNAAYLFDAEEAPINLASRGITASRLKRRDHLDRLIHIDGRMKWESKCAQKLAGYGVYPDETPTSWRVPDNKPGGAARNRGGVFAPAEFERLFRAFCAERGLRYEDRREAGGEIRVFVDAANGRIAGTLGQWGFTYNREQRCWVKK